MEGFRITRFAIAFSTALLVALIPILNCTVPPIHDYPFHLARADILASLDSSEFLQAHYIVGSFFLPNVGMDVAMIPLTRTLPILVAGRVFLATVLLVMLGGTVALHASLHRRLSLWPLLAAFFLYNWIFIYGFLNYLLGVGLMLWATAGWIALHRRPVVWRLAWATVMALVLLACHLEALGLFAVVIGGMELQRGFRMARTSPAAAVRDVALAALPFIIALAAFVLLSPTAGQVKEVMGYHGGRAWKPMVFYRTLLNPAEWSDLSMLSPLAIGLAWALWRRRLHIARPMVTALVLLVVTFAVMPFYLFGSQFGDARLPIAILLVAIAATAVTGVSRRTRLVVGLCALALLTVRSVAIASDWAASDRRIAAFTEAFRLLPDGTTLYATTAGPYPTIDYRDAAGLALWHPPLKHVVSLASLGRPIFVASTWADPYKQPMGVVVAMAPIKEFQQDNPLQTPTVAELDAVIARIHELHGAAAPMSPPDCLLLINPDRFQGALPANTPIIARGADFVLLRLP
jgi:hypothetical protein